MDSSSLGFKLMEDQASGVQGGSFLASMYNRATKIGKSSGHKNTCFPVHQSMAEEGVRSEQAVSLSPCPSLTKKVLSEFIGTFVLLFAAAGGAIVNEKTRGSLTILGCAAAAGLAVMIIVISTGHISGAHINPAVTLSFASLRHFPWMEVPLYIVAQVGGSISASYALKAIFNPDLHGGVITPQGGYAQAFILEFVTSAILMFVITAVATDTRAVGELAGIAVALETETLISYWRNLKINLRCFYESCSQSWSSHCSQQLQRPLGVHSSSYIGHAVRGRSIHSHTRLKDVLPER
ncbi:hypothetical protein O6H91_11G031300 [Diphasiastrum complanatum]|uniref:Uncharacterized protein n=1 Tax=Diphasiastrum complanatum TaxID=34168 RepID=A0ACC2C7Q2_DIPCM|nr:hypothetical protein O6H91_11G031300 [Diphasiastrum complanatum]